MVGVGGGWWVGAVRGVVGGRGGRGGFRVGVGGRRV